MHTIIKNKIRIKHSFREPENIFLISRKIILKLVDFGYIKLNGKKSLMMFLILLDIICAAGYDAIVLLGVTGDVM